MSLGKRLFAEFMGTLWLVFGGCGAAVIAAKFPVKDTFPIVGAFSFNLGIGLVGVSLAFGLTVLTMAYAVGHVSGGHFNPAVTLGLVAAKRFPSKDALQYIIAQVLGGVAGALLLYLIVSGKADFAVTGSFAANGYGIDGSPGGYSRISAFVAEFVLTFFFLFIIIGATDKLAPSGFAPIAIGLALTLIHLISIPITNTSVNPARSTGVALFASVNWAIPQLWLFWVAPILGAVCAGLAYNSIVEGAPDA